MQRNSGDSKTNYVFSIIIPVYNVEDYVSEALDSLINQTFPANEIEVIMIDDGSTDNSGSIIDDYSTKFANFYSIHIQNSGVSNARNIGIAHSHGEIIGFLDSDDMYSDNVLEAVYSFYCKNENVDVVSIPRKFFGGAQGDHILNFKFDQGTRVIDLNKEYWMLQNSVSFFRATSIKGILFDASLKYSEDTRFVLEVLKNNPKLGVVAECTYYYRKRVEGGSAVDLAAGRNIWYLPTFNSFSQYIIDNCSDSNGDIPLFLQYALVYELSWKIRVEHVDSSVVSISQMKEYKRKISGLLKRITSKVIMEQKSIFIEHKLYLLKLKFGYSPKKTFKDGDIYLKYGDYAVSRFSRSIIRLETIDLHHQYVTIDGQLKITPPQKIFDIIAYDNQERYRCQVLSTSFEKYALNDLIRNGCFFRVMIKLSYESNVICFKICVDGHEITITNVDYGKLTHLSKNNPQLHYYHDNWDASISSHLLIFKRFSFKKLLINEMLAYKKTKYTLAKKTNLFMKRWAILLAKHVNKKPIWVITDRINRAGDNGEALFLYLNENHLDIKSVFVLDCKSVDYKRLSVSHKVVKYGSLKHKMYAALCSYLISSQADHAMMNPFGKYSLFYNVSSKFIFLQHGVTKDDVSVYLSKYDKNIYGLITTGEMEYSSFRYYPYHYECKNIWNTGFPRFDRLRSDSKKYITIMPTWRAYLVSSMNADGSRDLVRNVEDSTFYKQYSALLSSKNLFDYVESKGYSICIMYHPNMEGIAKKIPHDDRLVVFPRSKQYVEIYAESDLIISDYSSTVFDFAYMKKPVIYFQPDYNEFFSGSHSYKKGYFSYEENGFGEVETDILGVISRIKEYVSNGCEMKDLYASRVHNFFTNIDCQNCKRLVNEILRNESGYWSRYDLAQIYIKRASKDDYKKAVALLEDGVKESNANCMYLLSYCYYKGIGKEIDISKAIELCDLSIQTGSLQAKDLMADLLFDSAIEPGQSIPVLIKIANEGNVRSQYLLGTLYRDRNSGCYDINEAARYLKMATLQNLNDAKQALYDVLIEIDTDESKKELFEICSIFALNGDLASIDLLIKCYWSGIGVDKNLEEARRWASKAVANGYKKYEIVLADILGEISTSDSINEMIGILEESAKEGNSGAMGRLGRLYGSGKLVEQDLKKSEYWLQMATEKNKWWEKHLIDVLIKQGTRESNKKAFMIMQKNAENGDVPAMISVSKAYRDGCGVKRNLKESASWLREAYSRGNVSVLMDLIDLLFMIGTKDSYAEAISLATSAANKGNSGAMGRLGRAYRDGKGVKKNKNEARKWFEKASVISPWWNKELSSLD